MGSTAQYRLLVAWSNAMRARTKAWWTPLVGFVACTDPSPSAVELNDSFSNGGAPNLAGSREAACADWTRIVDPALRAVAQAAAGSTTGAVRTLNADSSGIVSLAGIECLDRVERMHLAGNAIVDLSPLQDLPNLLELDVANNPLSGLEGLRDAPLLRRLTAERCSLTSAEVLSSLPTLQHVALQDNQITVVRLPEADSKLVSLNLGHNSLARLDDIGGELRYLESALFNDNQLVDISGIESLSLVRTLDLQNNQITDATPIGALTRLEGLDLSNNPLEAVSALDQLELLQSLVINAAQLTTLEFLSGASQLVELFANDNAIVDVSPLRSLRHLETLELSNNAIVDLTPLAENVDIGLEVTVHLSGNPLDCEGQAENLEALRVRGASVLSDCALGQ